MIPKLNKEGKIYIVIHSINCMYVKLKEQEKFIKSLIKKEGSYRRLAKKLDIPSPTFIVYSYGKRRIPLDRARAIIKYAGEIEENLIEETFENNFKQKLGGLKCVELKKKRGTFEKDMKKIQKIQSEKLVKWHKEMKDKNPQEYYKKQYNRFKKIGGYKFVTKKGEKVRNELEQAVANAFFESNIDYNYEPLVNVGKKYYFPDFVINDKILIECTSWKGETKAYKLKDKISVLKKKYKVFVIIPKRLEKYYQTLKKYLIFDIEDLIMICKDNYEKGLKTP